MAEVVFYDRFTQSREAIAGRIADERGASLVPPFDDCFIIAGQGTAGLEASRQLEALSTRADVVVCPASGGGLVAGVALAFEALSPATRLYAAEPAGFDDHRESLAAGHRVQSAPGARSLCDALLAPMPGLMTFAVNQPRLTDSLVVTDDEALAAMAFAFRHLKLVIEPGGAVALAALLFGKLELQGATAVVLASGGNVDPGLFAQALASN